MLIDFVQKELKAIIEEVCGLRKSEILAVKLMPDHVHLLVEIDPQYGIYKQYVKNQSCISSQRKRVQAL